MEPELLLRKLATNIAAAVNTRPDVLSSKIVEVPDFSNAHYTPHQHCESVPRPSACQFLNSVVLLKQHPSMQKIIEQLHNASDLVIWGHAPGYTKETVGQKFLDNYCHALVTGPDGPLTCGFPLGAFVLFGPETFYKDHSHAPNEVYLAVTDGGEWRVGNSGWLPLRAGDTIFIPSNAVHAIRTKDSPVLTFSFWLEAGVMEGIEI